jgi:hypothetical protein
VRKKKSTRELKIMATEETKTKAQTWVADGNKNSIRPVYGDSRDGDIRARLKPVEKEQVATPLMAQEPVLTTYALDGHRDSIRPLYGDNRDQTTKARLKPVINDDKETAKQQESLKRGKDHSQPTVFEQQGAVTRPLYGDSRDGDVKNRLR